MSALITPPTGPAPRAGIRQRLADALAATPDDRDGAGFRGFDLEAGDLMSRAKTQRAQKIVRAAVVVVVLLLIWAALAKVDEITKGDARVISSRQLQLVQSLDGGVVSEILVKEGQVVEKDQLLLKIDETRATSGVRESAAQGFALRARQARLRALAEGAAFEAPPASDSADERRIVEEERRLYETRLSELNTLLAINQQQLQQRQQELGEMRSRDIRSAASCSKLRSPAASASRSLTVGPSRRLVTGASKRRTSSSGPSRARRPRTSRPLGRGAAAAGRFTVVTRWFMRPSRCGRSAALP
jgi:adhesin transport system membrane fusion protein